MVTHATDTDPVYTAFSQGRKVEAGDLPEVVKAAKARMENEALEQVLIFDDRTGAQVDVDLNGPLELLLKHLPGSAEPAPSSSPRPGRPKLGVTAREVTLLPRHWEWLNVQPGGASITLRKLVEEARRADTNGSSQRRGQEACYRFIVAAGGNLPGFDSAARALFAGDESGFNQATGEWPADLREYALSLLLQG